MEKEELILQQEIIDYCDDAVKESKKLCDQILDEYVGNLEQKEVLIELSKLVNIDNEIKEKMKTIDFNNITFTNKVLDIVDELLKQKFLILDFLNITDEKRLV